MHNCTLTVLFVTPADLSSTNWLLRLPFAAPCGVVWHGVAWCAQVLLVDDHNYRIAEVSILDGSSVRTINLSDGSQVAGIDCNNRIIVIADSGRDLMDVRDFTSGKLLQRIEDCGYPLCAVRVLREVNGVVVIDCDRGVPQLVFKSLHRHRNRDRVIGKLADAAGLCHTNNALEIRE